VKRGDLAAALDPILAARDGRAWLVPPTASSLLAELP